MSRIFRGVAGAYTKYKFRPKPTETHASAAFLADLEAYARENGALAIGYAKITPDLIFKDFVIPHDNAIVIIAEMKKERFNTAPSLESMAEVAKVYADTTLLANQLSSYLRQRGFRLADRSIIRGWQNGQAWAKSAIMVR